MVIFTFKMKPVISKSNGHNFTICFIGINTNINIISSNIDVHNVSYYENRSFNIIHIDSDEYAQDVYKKCQPLVFVTNNSDPTVFKTLNKYQIIKNIWINYDILPDGEKIAGDCISKFIKNTLSFNDNNKISVITPTFNSKYKLIKPYLSLMEQTYKNWEWIIYDDCSTDKQTLKFIEKMCERDCRINFYTSNRNTSKIGHTKRVCSQLSTGKYIVELDHDDQLHEKCLEYFVKTFESYPDVGYASTDCAYVNESNNELIMWTVGNYTFGFGKYYTEHYRGKNYEVAYYNTNSVTIRHNVGMPNHARAWTKQWYNTHGGINYNLHIMDDFDLFIRAFLTTKVARIPRLGYIQYEHYSKDHNTTAIRNSEMQRVSRHIKEYYDKRIHERLIELNCPDHCWVEEKQSSNIWQHPGIDDYVNIIVPDEILNKPI